MSNFRVNITAKVDFRIERENSTKGVFIAAWINEAGCYVNYSQGSVFFFVFPDKDMYILSHDLSK